MVWIKMAVRRIFHGWLAILPVVATFYLIYWVVNVLEGGVGSILTGFLPDGVYRPGFGLIAALVILSLTGLALETYIARTMLQWIENLIDKVPMIKLVYRAMRDISIFLIQGEKRKGTGKPVWVSFGDNGFRVLGFVTLENPPREAGPLDGNIVVYLPMSYQIGGYTVVVSRERVTPASMSFEEAMRFVLTAGVAGSELTGMKNDS